MRLNIGPRLLVCFALIILSMLAGDALVLWQFQIVRLQAERLRDFDQELVAVLRVHSSLLAVQDKLGAVANYQDAERLVAEVGPLNKRFVEEARNARTVLSSLPSSIQPDPSILTTLEAVESTLESQFQGIRDLATVGDWGAVRLRLANQVHPLEYLTSNLVEIVNRKVSEEQARAALNTTNVQRRVLVLVPITVIFTLLVAGTLGLAITRSITRPLARLVECSRKLARGEFEYEVPVRGNDELSRLGQVFNDTGRQLQDLYASLQNSEDRLLRVINTIPAYVWSTRPDGSVDFLNQQLSNATGLSAEELLGSGWSSIVHPEDIGRYIEEWQVALAKGEPTESEVRIRTAHREYRWMLVRNVPLRDGPGDIIKWYGTGIDIEDRKRAEEQLSRSEAYLSEAQRLSRTGSFGWRVPSGEILWSEETYQIFGYDRSQKPSLELVMDRTHPEDKNLLRQLLEKASSNGTSFDTEHRLLMLDGAVKYLHVVAHARKASSEVVELIGAVTDVTPAKKAEDSLRKAQAELAHVNRFTTMGALTASIAHEVNQPLSGIVTNASTCLRMLDANPPNVEGARETARRTIRDGNRASGVITRLRALFSKKSATFESFDLNEAAKEVIALSVSELQRNSVVLQPDLATDLPSVLGDRIQIQQVILNLIRNGSDAMTTVDDRPRELVIKTESGESGGVRLSVKDSGVGIDPGVEEKLFEAFYTTKDDGMGIGLSVSRSIMESHQGRLWAIRNEGPGATFLFSIPCSTDT
ncbi:MAG: PAS domain-containing protein [Candidatus Acidiferrum sp.]